MGKKAGFPNECSGLEDRDRRTLDLHPAAKGKELHCFQINGDSTVSVHSAASYGSSKQVVEDASRTLCQLRTMGPRALGPGAWS